MEDVLDVYTRPYDPLRPQVCLDETSKQLVAETRTPVPTAPGRPARFDYEYERRGVCALFMLCEPLAGWREVSVSDHRGMVDFAHVIKHLVDDVYPHAEQIPLVMDNLNTHSPGSLYEAFEPAEAKRLADKLEIHYTPKHGSWLNMAEIELSVLNGQCLDRRIADGATLVAEVTAWNQDRNTASSLRLQYRKQFMEASRVLADLHVAGGEGAYIERAVDLYRRLLQADPLDERVLRARLNVHAKRSDATAVDREWRRLNELLRAADSAAVPETETFELYWRLTSALQQPAGLISR